MISVDSYEIKRIGGILMKHKDKLLPVLFTLAMLAGLLPWAVLPARAVGGRSIGRTS